MNCTNVSNPHSSRQTQAKNYTPTHTHTYTHFTITTSSSSSSLLGRCRCLYQKLSHGSSALLSGLGRVFSQFCHCYAQYVEHHPPTSAWVFMYYIFRVRGLIHPAICHCSFLPCDAVAVQSFMLSSLTHIMEPSHAVFFAVYKCFSYPVSSWRYFYFL